jgi:GAF domain-containing protein
VKPLQSKREVPFERFAHFIVAPAMAHPSPQSRSRPQKAAALPLPNRPVSSFVRPQRPVTSPPRDAPQVDSDLDGFIVDAATTTVADAAQKLFTERYNAAAVAYWVDIPSLQTLYSPNFQLLAPRATSLPGFSFTSQSILRTTAPLAHSNYYPPVDAQVVPQDGPLLIFPLFDHRDNLSSIVEIVRHPGADEFTEDDEQFVQYFSYKFRLYSRFLLHQPLQEPLILDILQLEQLSVLTPAIIGQLSNTLDCRACEVWRRDKASKTVWRFSSESPAGEQMDDSGIVGSILGGSDVLNVLSVTLHPKYSPKVDSARREALLAVSVPDVTGRFVYAIVLRGPRKRQLFTTAEEFALSRLAPFVTLAISNAYVYSKMDTDYQQKRAQSEGLGALLEVAEVLSGQLDIVELTKVIMEKGRQLTNADRCSLFLVNERRDRLITSFQRGLENAIDIPIEKGIAGEAVKQAKVIIIKDAYDSEFFDSSVDLETGYRTRSILSVPIFNNRGEVIGVTEMVNKGGNGAEEFTDWDSHMIKIFNVFCGISIENAKLYQDSKDMASQLRSFFDVSFSLSQSESVHRILSDIIHNARAAIKAERASLFLVDEIAGTLTSLITDGGKLPATLPLSSGVAGACATRRQSLIVNDAYEDDRFNREIDQGTGFITRSLCATPVISSTGTVLGVVEMLNKAEDAGGFNQNDMQMLQSFATFASVSLENSRLKDLAGSGFGQTEMPKYISEGERTGFRIPARLILSSDKQQEASSLSFFAIEWRGMPQIRLFFYLF